MKYEIFKIVEEVKEDEEYTPVKPTEAKHREFDEADAFDDQDMMEVDEGVATKNMFVYKNTT